MPISVKDLKEAQRPLPERIMTFLRANPDKAFSITEIIMGVEPGHKNELTLVLWLEEARQGRGLIVNYQNALTELVRANQVRSAEVQGITYYAAIEGDR